MNQLPIARDNFTSFAIQDGDIEYPDDIELFQSSVIVFDPKTEIEYIVADYTGDKDLESVISYDLYFDILFREDFVAHAMRTIKEAQIKELDTLEGPGGSKQRKAIEKITTDGTYTHYDELIKRKAYVRNFGNEMEEELETMPAEQLISFRIVFDYSKAPAIVVRRITVGAFELRFTAAEQTRITEAKKASADLARNHGSMLSRTHIHLDAPEIRPVLEALASNALLDEDPVDPEKFDSRIDEILRDGELEEQHRIMSYV